MDTKLARKCISEFVENVLRFGRPLSSVPLFADGINIDTMEYLAVNDGLGDPKIVSNFARQQYLTKLLYNIDTEIAHYAAESVHQCYQWFVVHATDSNGLPYWGGHAFLDLKTARPCSPGRKPLVHELKNVFPAYDILYQVNPEATIRLVRAIWNAHVSKWNPFSFNRHGKYNTNHSHAWPEFERFCDLFSESKDLSFLSTANDLMWAASQVGWLCNNANFQNWAYQLNHQFGCGRNQKTGLGIYQITKPLARAVAEDDDNTLSMYGDRALRQLGPELGPSVIEAVVLSENEARSIYAQGTLIRMAVARHLPANRSEKVLKDVVDDLRCFSKWGYIESENLFRPMINDGKDLSKHMLKRNGYYGRMGDRIRPYSADQFLLPYIRSCVQSFDEECWITAVSIARAQHLGHLGSHPGIDPQVNLQTENSNPDAVFALLDLYYLSQKSEYWLLAGKIIENIISRRFIKGWFVCKDSAQICLFDSIDAFAVLSYVEFSKGMYFSDNYLQGCAKIDPGA